MIMSASSTTKQQKKCDEPDVDTISMFVGQIPRTMTDAELREMFEEFGPVYQLSIIKNKATNESRGCCFVTFYKRQSALDAQAALHNQRTLPGMHRPIQMKPADTESNTKLFVGMISKNCTEEELREMFAPHGNVEDCTILRDATGKSKRCAFVTFSSRFAASKAIAALHHSTKMEGCSGHLVVKFADTAKEKEARKMEMQSRQFAQMGAAERMVAAAASPGTGFPPLSPGVSGSSASNLLLLQQLMQAYGIVNQGNLNLGKLMMVLGMLNSTGTAGGQPDRDQYHDPTGGLASMIPQPSNSMDPSVVGTLLSLMNSSGSHAAAATGGINPAAAVAAAAAAAAASVPAAYSNRKRVVYDDQNPPLDSKKSRFNSLDARGPGGCNLFINFLPDDVRDQDLYQMFIPYGHVLSAKVFIDKNTNQSKCFGFVSFDNPISAQNAVLSMNGYQIGVKRLVVELKKEK